MFDVTTMEFPIIAFTPNGVMPYTAPENLLRCMVHEYHLGWYNQLEMIDSAGACVVIESAAVVKRPMFARFLGRMVKVEVLHATKLADYDVSQTRDRTLEFLSIYPEMYEAAGVYEEILRRVEQASTTREIVQLFLN